MRSSDGRQLTNFSKREDPRFPKNLAENHGSFGITNGAYWKGTQLPYKEILVRYERSPYLLLHVQRYFLIYQLDEAPLTRNWIFI